MVVVGVREEVVPVAAVARNLRDLHSTSGYRNPVPAAGTAAVEAVDRATSAAAAAAHSYRMQQAVVATAAGTGNRSVGAVRTVSAVVEEAERSDRGWRVKEEAWRAT